MILWKYGQGHKKNLMIMERFSQFSHFIIGTTEISKFMKQKLCIVSIWLNLKYHKI